MTAKEYELIAPARMQSLSWIRCPEDWDIFGQPQPQLATQFNLYIWCGVFDFFSAKWTHPHA